MPNHSKDELTRIVEKQQDLLTRMASLPYTRFTISEVQRIIDHTWRSATEPNEPPDYLTDSYIYFFSDWREDLARPQFEEQDLDFIECVQGEDGVWRPESENQSLVPAP